MPFTAAASTLESTADELVPLMAEQIRQLDTRLRFIEGALDPAVDGPSDEEFVEVDRSRQRSTALASQIASMQASIGAVINAIDSPTLTVLPEPGETEVMTSPASTDLAGTANTSAWRSGNAKPAGWQPITRKR